MSVENAEKELKDLQQHRNRVDKRKAERQAERRKVLEAARHKGHRTPDDEARADELDKEVIALEKEAKEIRKKIRHLTDKHAELSDDIDDQERKVEKEKAERRKKRKDAHEDGPKVALAWMIDQEGVHESPPGSNWGHPVQDWEIRAGYTYAVPWCGCLTHEGIVVIGGADVSTQLGYAPNITRDANAGINGLKAVTSLVADIGCIGSLWHGEHVVTLRGKVQSNGLVPTIEGNTTTTDGSESDGGIVAIKFRAVTDFDVFAQPDW